MNSCDFCLVKVNEEDLSKVKETIIDKSPGFISFTALLKEIFGVSVEATKICSKCMDSIMSHYTFREQVFKNLKLNESVESSTHQGKVKNFLRQIEEPAQVIIHQNILSIVPDSQKNLFESQTHLINSLSPHVALKQDNIDDLKEKVKQEYLEAKEKERIDDFSGGIFGDDDYYSLQFSQVQSTSMAATIAAPKQKVDIIPISSEGAKRVKVVKTEKGDERVQEEEESAEISFENEVPTENQNNVSKTDKPTAKRRSHRGQRANVDSTRLNNSQLSVDQQQQLLELVEKSKFGKIYKCTECDSTFQSKENLYYHIAYIHILLESDEEEIPENNNSYLTNEQKLLLDKLLQKSKINFSTLKDDSSRLNKSKLQENQKQLLKELVEKSKAGNHYKCDICERILHTRHAIYYHIENRHLLKETSYETLWVSEKIQWAKNKGGNHEWECNECAKMYISHQALRAHLKLHYKTFSRSNNSQNLMIM